MKEQKAQNQNLGVWDISDALKKHTKMPIERLRVIRHLDELSMSTIRRGIVFIFAVWSGPAIIAFERFTRVLADIDTTELDLAVLDTDCLSSEAGVALWGRNVGGGGETLWIRDGVIVARSLLYLADSEQELVRHTQSLLAQPGL
jgi:hypothetical protein